MKTRSRFTVIALVFFLSANCRFASEMLAPKSSAVTPTSPVIRSSVPSVTLAPTETTQPPTLTPSPTEALPESNQIYDVVLDPPSPAVFDLETGIRIHFKYSSIVKDDYVLIFFRPMSAGYVNNNFAFTGSARLQYGFGSDEYTIKISSNPLFPEDGFHIDGIRGQMLASDKETVLYSLIVAVNYTPK